MKLCPEYKESQPKKLLSEYPNGTYASAGHLVSINAGFREKTPVIIESLCVGCFTCYFYCPDGVIKKNGRKITIDYDFCKGCGICASLCNVNAITMEVNANEA